MELSPRVLSLTAVVVFIVRSRTFHVFFSSFTNRGGPRSRLRYFRVPLSDRFPDDVRAWRRIRSVFGTLPAERFSATTKRNEYAARARKHGITVQRRF